MNLPLKLVLTSGLGLFLTACSETSVVSSDALDDASLRQNTENVSGNENLPNIIETALAAGSFNTLAAALEATGLISVLGDSEREFTVFAPTDEAFAKLGDDTINALLADPDTLRDILLYHVLTDTSVDATTAISLAGQTVTTANGDDIALSVDGDNLFINMSQVTASRHPNKQRHYPRDRHGIATPADAPEDMLGSIVDTAVNAGSFNTLVAALQATGLDAALANEEDTFTVFAPTDEAFAKLGDETINALLADPEQLSSILLYHVIAGQAVDSTTAISLANESVATANGASVAISIANGNLLINDSTVTAADVQATNGVIHVIDTVLIPPTTETEVIVEDAPVDSDQGTLLDIARSAGNFTILVAALEATGLDGAIGHPGDLYTVFAPTDDAFLALGQETIDALLADPAALENILLYHVLPGAVFNAEKVLSLVGVSIQAGNGQNLDLNLRNSSLFVNDSEVIATDIAGVNGIIHVIDSVLLPPAN